MARDMCEAERKLGLDSRTFLTDQPDTQKWDEAFDGDVHVIHSHIPDAYKYAKNRGKLVVIQHGTPEHCFETSVYNHRKNEYAPNDPLSMAMNYCKTCDAVVTFWARHAAIWETFTDRPIFVIPMGVDREFWKPIHLDVPALTGYPSIFTGENAHNIKWPLDIILMWPRVAEEFPNARLHVVHLPLDQHRFWFALANMNGAIYTANITGATLQPDLLRNFACSTNYYLSPVRYGDFNRMCLEMKACGAKVISFKGNEYADYWIPEGDQREQLDSLLAIMKGWKQPRNNTLAVPDIKDTALAMCEVYRRLLND